jgi:hypothetical protein
MARLKPMPAMRRRGLQTAIGARPPKDSRAALIQSLAPAVLDHPPEQALHRPDPVHQIVEFLKLPSRQFLPPLRCPSRSAEAQEQSSDFNQGEPTLPCPLDHREPIQHRRVVAPLSADSLRSRKQPDLLVVANGRWPHPNLSRNFGNRERRHRCIEYGIGSACGSANRRNKIPLAFKST